MLARCMLKHNSKRQVISQIWIQGTPNDDDGPLFLGSWQKHLTLSANFWIACEHDH